MRVTRSGWRVGAIVSEGYRNWRFGRWSTAVVILLAGLAFGGPAMVDIVSIDRLVASERDWLASGGTVLVVTNEAAGGIVSGRCDRLDREPGVAGAAALTRWPDSVAMSSAPDAPVTIVGATSGVSDLLALDTAEQGVIVPSDLADRSSLRAGGYVAFRPLARAQGTAEDPAPGATALRAPPPTTPMRVAAVSDLTLLGDVMGSGVLVPMTADSLADACFVRAVPGYSEALRSLLPSAVGPPGAQSATVVSDRLIGGRFSRDYAAEYRERGLRNAPFATGASIGLLWLLIRWLRRDADGLYATLGADRVARTLIRLVEWVLLVGGGTALGAAVIVTVLYAKGVPIDIVMPELTRALLVFVLTSTAVASLWAFAPMRSPLAALKDR